jgi:hypothetical protein
LAIALGTPAMALNPQPLPPGFKQPTNGGHVHILCSGQHFPKYTFGRYAR